MGDSNTSGSTMLQPGQSIRPCVTPEQARALIERLYGLQVTRIKELVSYDDRNFHIWVSDHHSNPHLAEVRQEGYVFKILNRMDSHKNHVGM